MQNRKRKISRKAETKAAKRFRVANLQQRIGCILNFSLLSNSSTDNIESEHEESDCDRNNVEESSIAETQESSDNNISNEISDGISQDNSDSEY